MQENEVRRLGASEQPVRDYRQPVTLITWIGIGPFDSWCPDLWAAATAAGLRFRAGRVGVFWLLPQGVGDGGCDEVEGLALAAGGFGEDGDGGGRAGEAELVAGEGGKVV
jgi:hypothetical protein